MKTSTTIALLFACAAAVAASEFDAWSQAAPDRALSVTVRRIPDPGSPHRLDLDGCHIFISRVNPAGTGTEVVAQRQFPGRLVAQIRWSPDSRFLLFTTASSGGHQPWHFPAFLFSAADRTFRDVEDATGAIVAADFRVESPNPAVLSVRDAHGAEGGGEIPSKEVRVSLTETAPTMARLP